MYPTAVNTVRTSHPYRQTIQFDVFRGCIHDGIPKMCTASCDTIDKIGLKITNLLSKHVALYLP